MRFAEFDELVELLLQVLAVGVFLWGTTLNPEPYNPKLNTLKGLCIEFRIRAL